MAEQTPVPTRVALVSSSFHPHIGGVEEHVRQVARHLAAHGHAVEVWTVDRGERLGTRTVDGITVRYLPTPLPSGSPRGVLSFLREAPAAIVAWLAAFRRHRPDLLHVHCFGPNGLYALALGSVVRRPLVLSSHGETFMDDHAVFESSWLLRSGLRRALARAAEVTACSDVVRRHLSEAFGGQDAVVVPNGIDVSDDDPPWHRAEPPTVLAAGRLEHMKGFDLLVDAYAEAARPDGCRLVVAGSGSRSDDLRAQVAARGLGDEVVFTGALTSAEVSRLMSSAALLAVPSRREAFGIVILEGWRAGVPVVVTSHGGPASLVTDGRDGLVVDPHDRAALTAALERLLHEPAAAAAMGAAGRRRVVAFDWREVAPRYERVYAEVLSARRPARRAAARS